MTDITEQKSNQQTIFDTQNLYDNRKLYINKVGIKDISYPIKIQDRNQGEQNAKASFKMFVDLAANVKGTHMSRFVEILHENQHVITQEQFKKMTAQMVTRLQATRGYIEMSFDFFRQKKAPITKVASFLDYKICMQAEHNAEQETSLWVKVVVPVTSLCPCSKKIADYGAHNQRSQVIVAVKLQDFMWFEEIIDIIEAQASCDLYGLLKRPDEKYVTEKAYSNPKFVEDIVRDIAIILQNDSRIIAYKVESENFESIHNHSAYAQIERIK